MTKMLNLDLLSIVYAYLSLEELLCLRAASRGAKSLRTFCSRITTFLNQRFTSFELFVEYYVAKYGPDNIYLISSNSCLTPMLMEKYGHLLNWNQVSRCAQFTPELITRYQDKIVWENLSYNPYLTAEIIEIGMDKLSLRALNKHSALTPELIAKHPQLAHLAPGYPDSYYTPRSPPYFTMTRIKQFPPALRDWGPISRHASLYWTDVLDNDFAWEYKELLTNRNWR